MGIGKDARIGKRVGRLIDRMVEKNSSVINFCCESHAERIAAYRLINNCRLVMEDVVNAIASECSRQCSCSAHVLCIQDTTELCYDNHSGRLSPEDGDFGYGTAKTEEYCIFAHPTLVVDAESCMPMGFSHMEVWNRSLERSSGQAKRQMRKSLKLEEKESFRWAEAAAKSAAILPAVVRKTMVGDRESDIYTVMSRTLDYGCDFLFRSVHDRVVGSDGKGLEEYMLSLPSAYTYDLKLRGHKGRKSRTARMHLRFSEVTFHKYHRCVDDVPETLTCYCVHALEDASTVPEGEEPIEWRLLTSHVVDSVDMAVQCVEWYKCRWFVEELFRVCKSDGFRLESAQLETGAAIKRLTALTMFAALRCMALKRAYDEKDEAVPASAMFNKEEMELLDTEMQIIHKKSPKALDGNNPFTKKSMPWAAWIIGRLGGWSGYESAHGKPGYITMKKGLDRFNQHLEIISFTKARNVYKE